MSTILVADDNSNIQKMVSLALEERGIQVVAVGNGEAAVRKIPEVRPDVVLADVFMPVRSGYEVCEFVKKDSRFSQTPVILLVGVFDPLDEKEARRVGADGVLKKPFVPPDPLIAMVTSFLDKSAKSAPAPAPAPVEQAAAPAPQAVAPPLAPASVPEPQVEPEPEPEQFATSHGPLSLRDEKKSPFLDGLLGTAGTQGEEGNPWDEPESEWQRQRAQMDYDIPGADARQGPDSQFDSHPATPPGADSLRPDDLVAEEPRPSVEPGALAELAANPTEWMEMMSFSRPAEESKPAPSWQLAAQSPEQIEAETQHPQAATEDASSLQQFGDWQEGLPSSEAQPETAVPSNAAEPEAQAGTEAPPEAPEEARRTAPMWPPSFEAEYGISAEAVLGSESAGAWPPAASLKPTTGDLGHGESTPGVAPSDESQHATGKPTDESTSKPEYELMVAPAAVIPFRHAAESTPPPQQTETPAPRDVEAESAPKEPGVSSLYASYLPGDIASDMLHTSEQESKAAPADLSHTGAQLPAAPSSLDPALVDAVVAKVLERLRPELQEILSDKLVRPLVESALEHEISKK